LHLTVARVVEERFSVIKEMHPEVLAHHWTEAGEADPAITEWQRAGERALERRAYREAEQHYRNAIAILGTLQESSERTSALKTLLELPEDIEQHRREFALQLGLGSALRGAKSWGCLETFHTFTRALSLGEKLAQPQELFEVLFGLTGSALARGLVKMSQELAERMLGLATTTGDRGLISTAQYRLSSALLWGGEFVEAHEYLYLATPYFDGSDLRRLPADSRIHARAMAANSALRLGFPDNARQLLTEALDIAKRYGTPYNEGFVHMFAIFLYGTLRDPQKVLGHADRLSRLAENIPAYSIFADENASAALLMIGKREEGITRMRRAVASGEFGLDRASRLAVEAQWCASEGRVQAGLATVDEGLHATVELRFYKSLFLRQRADFLLQTDAPGPEIEVAYREAIKCARDQGDKFDELESITHFARWLDALGRFHEARAILTKIYNWFTEGFDTLPLKEAKTLLEDLSEKCVSSSRR
jgi:tetratricopeptide (TPR) repeat protein